MWPVTLSGRLLIVALVGRYLTNKLIRRGSISYHRSFSHCIMRCCALMRFYQPFPAAIPLYEAGYPRVTHPSATKSLPKASFMKCFVRLACVKHAASVYPEPGSNSHVQFSVQFCANAFLSVCVSYLKDFTVFIGCSFYYAKNFTRLTAFAIWLFKKSSGLVILFNYQGAGACDLRSRSHTCTEMEGFEPSRRY